MILSNSAQPANGKTEGGAPRQKLNVITSTHKAAVVLLYNFVQQPTHPPIINKT